MPISYRCPQWRITAQEDGQQVEEIYLGGKPIVSRFIMDVRGSTIQTLHLTRHVPCRYRLLGKPAQLAWFNRLKSQAVSA